MNINTQWTQPDVYMWDQLLFPIKQNFIKPDDVWLMSNETAWKNCDFSGATFIGNASVGNDILTPPYLLAYASDFYFAAEANNGCPANQKIKITVLEGEPFLLFSTKRRSLSFFFFTQENKITVLEGEPHQREKGWKQLSE